MNLSTAEHSIADALRFNRTLIVNTPQDYPAFRGNQAAVETVGKHIATPIITGEDIVGGLLIGRAPGEADLTERDETLISTLAAQVAVTVENRRLFVSAENERGTLRSILDTLPAGVLVLDAETLLPIQYNEPVVEYLTRDVDATTPFSAAGYDLYRTGTNLHYPNDELPIMVARATGQPSFSDDISVITDEGHQTDLLINAAPIRDATGKVVNIVAAFENISNLRSLENTLQDNLRETISLYEATRTLSEADELNEVLDVVLFQLIMMEPEDAHLVLLDNEGTNTEVVRSMVMPMDANDLPPDILSDKRLLMIDNVLTDDSISDHGRQMLRNLGITSIASVPLLASKRPIPLGWMLVTYQSAHVFTPEDERFLSTLGDNAAVAIDNRYLFESTQSALRETSFLYSATTRISRARTLEDLGDVIRSASESLTPDIYATYLMTDPSSPDQMTELFNVNPSELPPVDFHYLLTKFGLFREENIYIEDLGAISEPTPFEKALIDMDSIAAFASVSLRVKGMPDGRVFLGYRQPQNFSEGDARYLNAIADSASVVIDNILLLEQVQTALEETSTLYQASRTLTDATEPDQILQVVVEKLIGDHVNQVFVALLTSPAWDSAAATVEVVASWQDTDGIDLQGISLTAEQFPAWRQLASTTVLTVDDVHADNTLDDLERMGIESLDTRALAIIPLRVPSRSIGSVWIGSNEPHTHTESEKRIFQAFAEQASLSLEASFLLEKSEARSRQLSTSAEVSQIASSILDLD
ncbi:MAG: GAF domain-containing protein, partial [Chloroflexota bacterium]